MRDLDSSLMAFLFLAAMTVSGCGPVVKRSGDDSSPRSPKSLSPSFALDEQEDAGYLVGAGTGDITGPVVGVATMGYAAPALETAGLHQRLWARAFAFAERQSPDERLVYVVSDICFISAVVKTAVVEKLSQFFGSRYNHANVMITATHNHSGPGAYSGHHMYNMPAGGFSKENFEMIVSGIVEAIRRADANMEPASIRMAEGTLLGYSRNRSIEAYERNPAAERGMFATETDDEVTLLRFDGENGTPIGLAHWFAVHATSVDKYNALITSDNKGYAAWRFESDMGHSYVENKGFVAAFANSNAGDSSPNAAGDIDGDGDWECAAGENFACGKWSGEGHYNSAAALYQQAARSVRGRLRSVHRFVDFSNITLTPDDSSVAETVTTCKSAIGLSMLAGSEEDGPGVGYEGNSCSTGGPAARVRCRAERFSCQGEKPVALNTGTIGDPTWTANVIPTQIFVIGNVALVGVPAELTTMSGRRLRSSLKSALAQVGVDRIIIAGYANAYSNYVATREEYQAQHYEGASTLYGEFTLQAYQQVYGQLARSFSGADLFAGEPVPPLAFPAARKEGTPTVDRAPLRRTLGELLESNGERFKSGQTVSVLFQGANLNHGQKKEKSIIEVQQLRNAAWKTVAYDWDFSTRVYWNDLRLGRSTVKVEWDIPSGTDPGEYRIIYHGWANTSRGSLESFEGRSTVFSVQ